MPYFATSKSAILEIPGMSALIRNKTLQKILAKYNFPVLWKKQKINFAKDTWTKKESIQMRVEHWLTR